MKTGLKNMKNKIFVTIYNKQYGKNELAEMMSNKDFGFEFSIENETERNRRIFSFEEIIELKKSIDAALKDYKKYSLNLNLSNENNIRKKSY